VVAYSYDPELADALPLLPTGGIQDLTAERARLVELVAGLSEINDDASLEINDYSVAGHDGDPTVGVRVFRSRRATGPAPALVYIHGGGFVAGNILCEQDNAAALASTLGIVVASVEYRLAPEYPFPAGLHDCYAALQWLFQQADELGVDPTRVGVYGQSAGGGLAAGLALFSRDRNGPPLCFQFLAIPELDDRLKTQSMRTFVDTPQWDRASAELSWDYYLGSARKGEVSPYAAPARAQDLRNLPPAYVSTMEFDPLRDEGILYALGLLGAGVSVELHSYPGTFHGSSMVTTAGVSQRMANEQMNVLRRALGITPSE
jgi:acetyl esterase